MKAVLISIQPKWVEKIASGEKTIEVRKTMPKLETPFKCYIYATWNGNRKEILVKQNGCLFCEDYRKASGLQRASGKVIGEFVCDRIDEYRAEFTDLEYYDARDKNVCQNTIKRVEEIEDDDGVIYRYETSNEEDNPDDCVFLKKSCLTFNEIRKYIGQTFFDKPFYGWHISDLKIYDKPKELSEFYQECKGICVDTAKKILCLKTKTLKTLGGCDRKIPLKRPPQSWGYCEELKELQNG